MTKRRELRKRLIAALRSGDYQQGRGRLRGIDGYCCLGVAAEVAGEVFLPRPDASGEWYIPGRGNFDQAISRLPDRVVEAYGFRDSQAEFSQGILPLGSLAHMNDTGKTFDEIADFIEQNSAQVFVTQ